MRLNWPVYSGLLIFMAVIVHSCKKETTPAEENTVSATFTFSAADSWPESYQIILGAFGDDSTQTSTFTVLNKSSEDETVAIKLERVSASVKNIKLCMASNGKVVYTFYNHPYQTSMPVVPLQHINLLSYPRIQAQVFNAHCITCHGGASGNPAAGMYLTAGKSYDELVNHQAKESAKVRVMPFYPANSFLTDVLRMRGISFEHSASRSISEENIELIELWIQKGALLH